LAASSPTQEAASKAPEAAARTGGNRAFRGLFLVFLLTFLNLAGILLTAIGLNALDQWTTWQFIGLFGVVEAGSGLANLVTPNLWAMPVIEQETSHRTRTVLALETLGLMHWGGLARTLAGTAMIGAAAFHEGIGPGTALVLPLCLLIGWLQVVLSALLARGGVAAHDYDVLQITLNWHRQIDLPPISLSASALQFCLSLITLPAVSILAPAVLYRLELAPAPEALAWLTAACVLATAAAIAAWYPRIAVKAPREQQQEAEVRA
jgi:hypothetical protein